MSFNYGYNYSFNSAQVLELMDFMGEEEIKASRTPHRNKVETVYNRFDVDLASLAKSRKAMADEMSRLSLEIVKVKEQLGSKDSSVVKGPLKIALLLLEKERAALEAAYKGLWYVLYGH
jgi:hypothetical protein